MLGIRTFLRNLFYPFADKSPHQIKTEFGIIEIPHVDAYSRSWLHRSKNSLNGWHEPSLTWFLMLAGTIGNRRTLLDAGSHLGYFSFVHTRVPENLALAVELNPAVFRTMSDMISRHYPHRGRIVGLNVGLSSSRGVMTLPHATSFSPSFSLVGSERNTGEGRNVGLETLDALADAQGINIDLMKIDIEGAEFEMLKGAEATLRRLMPIIAIELHPKLIPVISSQSAEDLISYMKSLGYRQFQFLSGRAKACTKLTEGFHPQMSDNPNLVFVADSDSEIVALYNSSLSIVNNGAFPNGPERFDGVALN
ncbi:MAG TPA: FkbM family methyltransferase [Paracoccaceae bacterium]|nr:FkbM family methyltransferase [Paracoccaceae bacterium]HMO71086.1 FkbM family methyltransferase [Paracoccaceae bacterium]